MQSPPILLGYSDFASLRERGGLYIDKSGFVSGVLRSGAAVQLYPRPRRFGKTLNLSTLRYFLEKGDDRSRLFEDLTVWQDESVREHFQRYPVINLSFREVKQRSWGEAFRFIQETLSVGVTHHAYLLDDSRIDSSIRDRLRAAKDLQGSPTGLLRDLSLALSRHHGEQVVILIDEYDAPILTAWEHGYFEDASAWFRSFLAAGLKDNALLFKGVLTGILRVARESMFSDLNNVTVYSLLQTAMPEPFGFSEPEVQALLLRFGREGEGEEIRRWYNGYRLGGKTVYNPWSILNVLSQPDAHLQPWWLNTSANALVRRLLLERIALQEDFATLIAGGHVRTEVDEKITLRDLSDHDLWSLLLFSGYLRVDGVEFERRRPIARLSIPNLEVLTVWEDTFLDWLRIRAGNLESLHEALLSGAPDAIERELSGMLLRHVSAHDVKQTQDEAFYQAFVLGLLVILEPTHSVRSNRETGLGRADVLLLPKQPGQPGVVLEFKRKEKGKGKDRSLESAAEAALQQIHDLGYAGELEAVGAAPIHLVGIAFSGKEVVVRAETLAGR